MASLTEFRREYPQYNHLSDQELVGRLYERYYADSMSREDFEAALGLTESGEAPQTVGEGEYNPFASGTDLFTPPQQGEAPLMMPIGGEEEAYAPILPTDASEARNRMIPMLDDRSSLQRFQEFLSGTVDASAHNAFLGGDDELTRFFFGEDAERQLEESQEEFAEDNPTAAAVAGVAGALGAGGAASRAGATLLRAKNPTAMRMGTRGAAEGAGYGATYEFLDTEGSVGDRMRAAGRGAVTGAAIGGPLGVIGSRGARGANDLVPSPANNLSAKQQLYGMVDQSGVVINGQAVFDLARSVRSRLAAEGIDVAVLPAPVLKAIRLIDNASTNHLTLQSFDLLRQRIRDLSKKPSNRHLLGVIIDEMDSFANGLTARQIVAGNAPDAVGLLHQARRANVQVLRDALIAKALRRAANRGNTLEALQNAFRRIDENPADIRLFTPDEQRIIQQIIRGDNLTNALAAVASISSQGFVQSIATIGGTIPAIARQGARRRTRSAAQELDRGVRYGGKPPRVGPKPELSGLIAGGAIYGQPPMLPAR